MASGPPMLTPIVVPSGSALATASVPILPLAPGLFSTTKADAGYFCCRFSAISRATISGVEPAPNGTMIFTVFAGQSCASAGTAMACKAAKNTPKRKASFFMFRRLRFLAEKDAVLLKRLLQARHVDICRIGLAGKRQMRRGRGGFTHDKAGAGDAGGR